MLRLVLFFLLLFTCAIATYAQDVLHDRLGVSIDTTERYYFGLFPKIQGFASATAHKRADGGADVLISRSSTSFLTDTTLSFDALSMTEFNSYINNYELLRRSRRNARLAVKWDLLKELTARSPVIESRTYSGKPTTIVNNDNVRLEGLLLYTSDSTLYLWRGAGAIEIDNMQQHTQPIRYDNIRDLRIDGVGGFWPAAGYGALFGAMSGTIAAGAFAMFHRTPFGSVGTPLFFISYGTIVCGLLTGLVSELISKDVHLKSGFTKENLENELLLIRDNAAYPAYPPPELQNLSR